MKSYARRAASKEAVDIETTGCFHLHREESATGPLRMIVLLASRDNRPDYCSSATGATGTYVMPIFSPISRGAIERRSARTRARAALVFAILLTNAATSRLTLRATTTAPRFQPATHIDSS